jgi:alkane 1-monooxygenase
MSMKDLKYFLAYLLPISAFIGFYFRGPLSGGSVYLAFVIIPLVELFIPGKKDNLPPEEEERRRKSPFFDWLLYANVPILYSLLAYYLYLLSQIQLTHGEVIGLTINMGVVLGAMGINVAHELGHRNKAHERLMAKLMLLPALYMHFTIEHNYGHHRYVGTPEDPATARRGEMLYVFWWRSITQSWLHAWKLEKIRLSRAGRPFLSLENEMIRLHLIEGAYLILLGSLLGPFVLSCAILAALAGIFLLETVNYIEHYGLMRKRLPSGRYEKVERFHSWNSNHELGRIFLYELTRHADHHYKATRKYQVLRHFEESPQLPYGYPASMLLALVPPLWFYMMNRKVNEWNANRGNSGEKPMSME